MGSILRQLLQLTHIPQTAGLCLHIKCENNEFRNKETVLLVTGKSHHTEDTFSMFSQHLHAFTSSDPIILLTMQKANATKSNCRLVFRIPAVFHLHWDHPLWWVHTDTYCLQQRQPWRRFEGDSYTPPDLALWIWMAVSVQVALQRREMLLGGPQTCTSSWTLWAGAYSSLVFIFSQCWCDAGH